MSKLTDRYIAALVRYGINTGLLQQDDSVFAVNRLLEALRLEEFSQPEDVPDLPLEEILTALLDDAVARGICDDNITARDLLDTKLMGAITPFPSTVRGTFSALYRQSPQAATDYFYRFSQDTDYIRRYRIKKDQRWTVDTPYGMLDITINLSKPEKDPRAIAAAKNAPQRGYPKCALCPENEGYAGHLNHAARQNHRIIPLELQGEPWYLQYSPYVYYNEHCIVFSQTHAPMVINRSTFAKLLEFVSLFPHYMLGSNADLPIVGGSILSHEHFQGGRYTFPMERAPIETELTFPGFENIRAGIVRWPMGVIRLSGKDRERLTELADRILSAWRSYTDEAAVIYAETDGVPHNTIAPIARMRGDRFELDLVLRNNLTTLEHPLGLYHPHEELHHIKKENIGLIEVMGLAVLPARLKQELAGLEASILEGRDISADPELAKHAVWVEELRQKHTFTPDNTAEILRQEVGLVFARVLEQCGVFSRTQEGLASFLRFVQTIR